MIFKLIKIASLGFIFLSINGQNNYSLGLLPSVNLNYEINSNWSVNTKIESRFFAFRTNNSGGYALSDASLMLSKTAGANSKLNLGYLHRFDSSGHANRFVQQIVVVKPFRNNRIAHRIGLDQTFSNSDPLLLRVRYRCGIEFSISGIDINEGEPYGKIFIESLHKLNINAYTAELRFSSVIGKVINVRNKLELGLEHRYDNIGKTNLNHASWLLINWYLKF